MMTFDSTTGIHNLPVMVAYDVREGSFNGFYVLHRHTLANILGYLSVSQIEELEQQAQRHYMEQAVNKNELAIRNGD